MPNWNVCWWVILAILIWIPWAGAQSPAEIAPPKPATMELLVPAGASVKVDERDLGEERTITFDQFTTNRFLRSTVSVRFADGTEATRLVDLEPGRHVRVPINLSPRDKPAAAVFDSPSSVQWASFSPDGKRCVTGTEDHQVVIWDFATGKPAQTISAHDGSVNSVVFSRDGELLLTASADRSAILWDVRTAKALRRFRGHSGAVKSAVFSPDGKQILTGSADKTAILWNAATGAQIKVFTNHVAEVLSVAFSPDGSMIATAESIEDNGRRGRASAWNINTGESLFTLRHRDSVSGIEFSRDGAFLATSSFENVAFFWNATNGEALRKTRTVNLDLNGVGLSPDSRWLFTAGKDANVRMWNVETAVQRREFPGHLSDIQSVTISPDGQLLLSASLDGTARLFEIATGAELACLATALGGKSWAVVAPDGLFDASEQGRRRVGFRFAAGKLPGAAIGQFFDHFYHPGLLAELMRGQRPMARKQLAKTLPPVLKIVSPKTRSVTNDSVTVTVEAVDKGGGISGVAIYNNDARLAVEPEVQQEGNVARYSFKLPLKRGLNQIRVTASCNDGTWQAAPAEIALSSTRRLDRKSQLFVVAAGFGDAQALAELFKRRSVALYDRVNAISLIAADASRERIQETLIDVAALTEPQDTLALILCGQGEMHDGKVYFTAQKSPPGTVEFSRESLAMDDLIALVGAAPALERVLILDAEGPAATPPEFGLRGTVERWSRAQGLIVIAALASRPSQNSHGVVSDILLNSVESNGADLSVDSRNAVDVTDWFAFAARNTEKIQRSSQSKGFPLLVVER